MYRIWPIFQMPGLTFKIKCFLIVNHEDDEEKILEIWMQQQQGNISHSPDAASGSFPNYGGDPGDDDGEDIKTLDNDDDDDSENDES